MKRISISSLVGALVGFFLFIFAIYANTDNWFIFFSLSSLLMVIGGTIAVSMMAYEGQMVWRALSDIFKMAAPFNISNTSLLSDAELIMRWSDYARKHSIMGLEDHSGLDSSRDTFLQDGLLLLISGYKGPTLRRLLHNNMESMRERESVRSEALKFMTRTAPAFGMIGTLVGLVIMLSSMANNPDQLGSGLALALLTTLYGLLFAQISGAAAIKSEQRVELDYTRRRILGEGFILLADGRSPMNIQDTINSYLDPNARYEKPNNSEHE